MRTRPVTKRESIYVGCYFSWTDRAPKPGEYKYATQGSMHTGALLVSFTVLTNDGQQKLVAAALAIVKNAVHIPARSP